MIPRALVPLIKKRLRSNPAVVLVGPRQSGKPTLACTLSSKFFDMEQEADRLKLNLDWDDVESGKRLVVFDEAQSWPELYNRLRGSIDRDRKRMNRFLLTGSVSPALMRQVSESLAGRCAVVELTPLSYMEVKRPAQREKLWLHGGFPDGGLLRGGEFPHWQLDYLDILAQRDLPLWGLPARPQVTQRLFRMLAAVHGQTWNASAIGRSLGLSHHTVSGYLDYLEGAFLIRRIQPYHANLKKRLVKSPKVFWRDSGLLHALLQADSRDALLARPWVGASWEGFVIEQLLAAVQAHDVPASVYFLRTSDGHEIDLVVETSQELWAMEVKLTTSPRLEDMRRLNHLADLIGADRQFLVSQTRRIIERDDKVSCNLTWLVEWLSSYGNP